MNENKYKTVFVGFYKLSIGEQESIFMKLVTNPES
jgi:hypothetical protein